MNIKKFASVPKLTEVKLDDAELVERYGEEITFYTHDIVTMTTYFDFFSARSENDFSQLSKIMKGLILNEEGKPALEENEDLPIDIAAAAMTKLGEILGKSQTKTSTQTVGEAQN
jgi:hypothetical protein